MDKPICVCGTEMVFFMDNRIKKMFECPVCGKLLLRFKDTKEEHWYMPLTLECLRCGWTWQPRTSKLPKVCPNPKCKSPYWNRPRKPAKN